jgi:hypothetical protein
MDTFSIIVVVGFVLVLLTFLALGRFHSRSSDDIVNKRERIRWGELAAIEERDIPMMLREHNRYRERRGAAPVSEEEFRAEIGRQQLERLDEADREVKEQAGAGVGGRGRERRGF